MSPNRGDGVREGWTHPTRDSDDRPVSRLANRVPHSEPNRGPLRPHHLAAKTENYRPRTKTRVVGVVAGDPTRLIDHAWGRQPVGLGRRR